MTGLRVTTSTQGVVLRDGSEVLIRPVHSGDAALLAEGFARLSARSRQLRFLTGKPRLSAAELRYFTDIDHHDHEALGALSRLDGRGVGVARYVRHADDPQSAELAVTIVDEWQGRGLGSELVNRLTERARQEGIHRFTALVAADNAAMIGLLASFGGEVELVSYEDDALEYKITPRRPADADAGLGRRATAWRGSATKSRSAHPAVTCHPEHAREDVRA